MPMEEARVAVVGSANLDLTFRTPRLPRPGETLIGTGFQIGLGGKGANQAVMAARLGARVHFLGRVGNDVFGEQMLGGLRAEGIDTTHVSRDDARPTGVAGIVVDANGQNCILVVPGANHGLASADVRAAASVLQSARVLVAQLETPLEATGEAFRLARAARVATILNPAPAAPLPDELLRLTDLCIPNETELAALTGHPTDTLADVETAAHLLHGRGPGAVLVTLGARGALLVDDRATHVPAVPVQAVDSSGAGDAFIGTLAVLLAEGRGVREALRPAAAVAALSVTRPGTQTSFPTRAEVAHLW